MRETGYAEAYQSYIATGSVRATSNQLPKMGVQVNCRGRIGQACN